MTPHVLLSAYACDPARGSEPGVGFHWLELYLAAGCRVTAVVHRDRGGGLERTRVALAAHADRLRLIEVDPGTALRALRALPGAWYPYYRIYQRRALSAARQALAATGPVDWVHHVSQNGFREPGGWHRLGLPFVWGPIGGLQDADPRLVRLQGGLHRAVEALRAVLNRRCARFAARPRAARARARVLLTANAEAHAWAAAGAAGGRVLCPLLETAADAIDRHPPGWASRDGVLWVGSDEPRKNPEFALLAHALLRRVVPASTLTMVGLSPWRERSVRRWAVAHRVPLAGVAMLPRQSRDALAALYRRSRVFWFTSYRDTSGNVLLEALAHGTPVVAFAQHGARAILAGLDAMLVDPAPAQRVLRAWVAATRRSLCDQRTWSALSAAGTRRLLERYRWDAKWPVLRAALRLAGLPAAASSPCSVRMAPGNPPCSTRSPAGSPCAASAIAASTGAYAGAAAPDTAAS